MSFRINSNISAMGALRNLNMNSTMFNKSINRLSTGMRINSAADDPAGLIVSENFRAQISGVSQAIRNNQDAMNYAKTAEGALDEIARLLREGRELAVQSGNTALLDANQIQANQNQWNLMVQSVNRIATDSAKSDCSTATAESTPASSTSPMSETSASVVFLMANP